FFQADDVIRDFHVTGVQTCALPISFRFCCIPQRFYPPLQRLFFIQPKGFFWHFVCSLTPETLLPMRFFLYGPLHTTCNSTSRPEDRKSTRLNSSHVKISYAVFCLKK